MKKRLRWLCVPAFLALCAAVWLFFQPLTQTGGAVPNLVWDTCAVVDAAGNETPFDPLAGQPEREEGTWLRFTALLPRREDFMYLSLVSAGAGDAALTLDGAPLWSGRTEATADGGQSTLWLTLSPGGGERLTLDLLPDGALGLFPPILQLTSDPTGQAESISYANYYALPAGATALALVLLWGLFLLGAGEGRPDWKLLLLLFAAAELTVYPLFVGFGAYFFPPELLPLLTWRGWPVLTAVALTAYLLLQRERAFWKALGLSTFVSAGALLLCWGLSALQGGYLGRLLPSLFAQAAAGYLDGLLYWLTLWLEGVCVLLSAWRLARSYARARADAQALMLKNQMVMDSYQAIEDKLRQSAALRHEFSHQLAALDAMYQEGDLEQLGRSLAVWKTQNADAARLRFTGHLAVNAILQDASARAEAAGVHFTADASLPERLPIPHEELCALLMNLLDNALEGAARTPAGQKAFLRFHARVTGGFLAVRCENSFDGHVERDDHGRLRTTKPERAGHGFGLPQMTVVAEKYHSILDVSYTDTCFTVQTALKLPEEP